MPLPFLPYQKDVPVHATKSNLPHWSQTGSTHFITFRQADSIPTPALERWQSSRREWLARHGLNLSDPGWFAKLPAAERRDYRRLFGDAFERLLDSGKGSCLLAKPENRIIVANSLRHFENERYALGDYVIMPNHVHLLLIPNENCSIQKTIQSVKKFTAREINQREDRAGNFWQIESFDHIVRTRKQLDRLREYIAENPIRANLPDHQFTHFAADWSPPSEM